MPKLVPLNSYNPRSESKFGEGYIESQYDVEVPYGKSKDEYRANRQTFSDSLANATGRGLMGALVATGETVAVLTDWEGIYNRITGKEDDFNNFLMRGADNAREFMSTEMPEYHSNKFGDMGWWMNGYSSTLESAGYFVVGGAVGEMFGLAGKAVGLATRPLQLTQGIGTAITMNYTEGVQIAHQSYQQMIAQGIPKEIASDKASKLIDANRINILFELPQYLSMFRATSAYDYSRRFKNIDKTWKSNIAELAKQGMFEGTEELAQGYMQSEVEREARLESANNILLDPTASASQKDKAKKILASENLSSNGVSRFMDYALSDQGMTEAIFGAFGGMVFEGFSTIKESMIKKGMSEQQAESAARQLIADNPTTITNLIKKNDIVDQQLAEAIDKGDALERDRLVRQKFINLATMNATRGSYAQFMRTVEGLSTMSKEEMQEFGVDADYLKKQAPKMLEDAKFIESIYNDVIRKFQDLPANDGLEQDVRSKIIASALNSKWEYREFENFKKEATQGKNKLYTEYVSSEERQMVELKHQLEAYEEFAKDKNAREILKTDDKIRDLKNVIREQLSLYNTLNNTKKKLEDFANPLVDDAGFDFTVKEIQYETQKENAKNKYNKLVENRLQTFEDSKKLTEESVEETAKVKQTAEKTAENNKGKQEQSDIANETIKNKYSELIKNNSSNPQALQKIYQDLDQEVESPAFTKKDKNNLKFAITNFLDQDVQQEASDDTDDFDELVKKAAKINNESEKEVHDKNSDLSGDEAYNPLPFEFENEATELEEELVENDSKLREPNAGANTQALATNLMNFTITKSGKYIHYDEVNPTANIKMFDPDFIKPGDKLIIFVDTSYETYEENKNNLNELPLAVVREEDYNKGDREPIAYIHVPKWYENNDTIPESSRRDLAEETRLLRNVIFQTKDQNGNFIPHSTTVIDKSIGVLTKSDKNYSIFEVTDNPNLVVAKSSDDFVGMTEEQRNKIQLTHRMITKKGDPMVGVPFLLVKSPNGKFFPKFVRTHEIANSVNATNISNTIFNIFKEFYTNPESQLLTDAKIKNFMDLAYEIKKFVYFGDKTKNLDPRKLFFATEDGKVNIQGTIYDFSKELNKDKFIESISKLYGNVNTKHLDPKESSRFSYLTWKDNKFVREYSPYKKFLDDMGFISINSKPNHGTIFGNYVTKIDTNIKPIDQEVKQETKTEEITEEKVANEPQKAYIKSSKKSPFKKATAKKQISDEEAEKRKKNCD